MMMRAMISLAAATLLGACAAFGPPDIETSRSYANLGPEALYQRTLEALRASQLEVTRSDPASGVIGAVGRFEQRGWAECTQPRRIVEDSEDREEVVGARVDYRRVELMASVQGGAEGATLTLDPSFTAEPVSPMATTEECRTTGQLERQILEAVAAQS